MNVECPAAQMPPVCPAAQMPPAMCDSDDDGNGQGEEVPCVQEDEEDGVNLSAEEDEKQPNQHMPIPAVGILRPLLTEMVLMGHTNKRILDELFHRRGITMCISTLKSRLKKWSLSRARISEPPVMK